MITLDDLRVICPLQRTSTLAMYEPHLRAAMGEFGINTAQRARYFISQVAHESGGFQYVREIASGAAYDGREDLGNTKPEAIRIAAENGSTPGRWWKGHGLIQITGFDNHFACGVALGVDLLRKPDLLERPDLACRSAGWFWRERGLNEVADTGNFVRVTKKINGGTNGLQDRLAYLTRAEQVLA